MVLTYYSCSIWMDLEWIKTITKAFKEVKWSNLKTLWPMKDCKQFQSTNPNMQPWY
jgi:hypothetical protein